MTSRSRRDFLKQLSATIAAGGASAFLPQLGLIGDALAATRKGTVDPYRAIVCVYLAGGNDAFNFLVPTDARYSNYLTARSGLYNAAPNPQGLGFPRAGDPYDPANNLPPLIPLTLASGSGTYGLNPYCPELAAHFNAQRLAFIANIGTLVMPITKAEYGAGTVPKPPQLFSHNDQENLWHLARTDPNFRQGWGGQSAELVKGLNSNATALAPCISLNGANKFEIGPTIVPYQLSTGGATQLAGYVGNSQYAPQRLNTLNELLAQSYAQPLTDEYKAILSRSIDLSALLTTELAANGTLATTFPATALGSELEMVARMIKVSRGPAIGHTRQVYYVRLGGFDTHTAQTTAPNQPLGGQGALLQQVSQALDRFYAALVEIGAQDDVMTFTMSEFSRTLSSNGNGTDHAWGGIQLVMGNTNTSTGHLAGGRVFGTYPDLVLDGPESFARGQYIPSTAVEQMMATLSGWLGVQSTDYSSIYPNLFNFPAPVPFIT
jgi:uncharacterized protein (DUF1501 family)